MSLTEYRQMHLRIARVLAPEMSRDDMEQACVEDWQGDLRGGSQMTFERYVSRPRCSTSACSPSACSPSACNPSACNPFAFLQP